MTTADLPPTAERQAEPPADGESTAANDPHRLRPEDLPTPFTAEEIRRACGAGRELRLRVEVAGSEPVVHVMSYRGGDAERELCQAWDETPDGKRIGEVEEKTETWLELQDHASFPSASTVRDDVELEILGERRRCLRYTQRQEETVRTFWFALDLPGPPIRWEVRRGDVLALSVTAAANRAAR